jgi:hypothetical protein
MIRYWQSQSDEFGTLANTPIDDTQDAWFAGVARCFAGVALAGALAANGLRAQAATRVIATDDAYTPPPPVGFVDDDAGWNPSELTLPRLVIPQPFTFEQHENAAGLYGVAEDDAGLIYRPSPAPIDFPQPFAWEQQENAAGLYGVPEDEPQWVYRPPASPITIPSPAGWWTDEVPPQGAPSFVPDEDVWLVVPQLRVPTLAPVPWFAAQDDLPLPGSIAAEDEYRPVLSAAVPLDLVPPWFGAADEFLSGAAPAPIVDEDTWVVTPIAWTSVRVLPFVDDTDFVPVVADGDEWSAPRPRVESATNAAALFVLALDDGSTLHVFDPNATHPPLFAPSRFYPADRQSRFYPKRSS